SISTVKADAARNAFAALGEDIVWAVIDSGIDATHPHFGQTHNLELAAPVDHKDFSRPDGTRETALTDQFGHGTHVAGIIAGQAEATADAPLRAAGRYRDESGTVKLDTVLITKISGMAPRCKLVSLKVLDEKGKGKASNLIAAIAYVQKMNGNGR